MHMKIFLCFCIRKHQKCYREFSYWLRVNFYDSNPWVFFNHWLEPTFLFWFENKGDQLFLIWFIFLILIKKSLSGLCWWAVVTLKNKFWLPKSAQFAMSAQMDENSHSFFNVSYTWYKSLIQKSFWNYLTFKAFCPSSWEINSSAMWVLW